LSFVDKGTENIVTLKF